MSKIIVLIVSFLFSTVVHSSGTNVFGLGVYDIKLDGSEKNQATDFRYEFRSDNSLLDIGPEEDNLGELFEGNKSKYYFTPSFGAGFYDDGSGKKLGNTLQFRTSFELSYELKNNNRIGISFSHISNANLGDKNPGVEILSFSYHIPY